MKAGELGDKKRSKRDLKTIGKLRRGPTLDEDSKIRM